MRHPRNRVRRSLRIHKGQPPNMLATRMASDADKQTVRGGISRNGAAIAMPVVTLALLAGFVSAAEPISRKARRVLAITLSL